MTVRRTSKLMASSALCLAFATPALAQNSSGDGVDEGAVETAGGDIVVTARRVEERLQDVPISITVFNQAQIDDRNIINGKDLAIYTPSLSTNSRFGSDYATFAIRGFTQEQRTTASVGVYFADVVAPRSGGAQAAGDGAGPGGFFDLQNVQVLKGPQGTLFGRNTTGGAVLLVPKKPSHDFNGYIEGTYGSHDMRRFQAVVNIPLADTFRIRAGVDWNQRDGWLRNVSGIGPTDFADIKYVAARLSVVADLTPNLENYTILSYSNSTPHGTLPVLTDCFPTVFPLGTLACDQLARNREQGWNVVDNTRSDATQQLRLWQIINTTTWKAGDNLTIKNIASYAQVRHYQRIDLFGARYVVPAVLTNPNTGASTPTGAFAGQSFGFATSLAPPSRDTSNQETFTEEVQIQGSAANGRLAWQAGGYYEKNSPLGMYGTQSQGALFCTDSDLFKCTDTLRTIVPTAAPAQVNYAVGQSSFQSLGLYAQGSFDITEQLKFTAGLRYTWDRSRSIAQKVIYRFPAENNPVGSCTNPALRAPSLPVTDPAQCQENFSQNSEAPTWVVGLDYKPGPDVMVYAKWARGYRQGSTNPFSAEGLNTFNPEKVDTYEIGAKTTFRGAVPGHFNIAGFYNDFRQQQLQVGVLSTTAGLAPNVAIVNAGKSRIWGIEVEASIRPLEGLRLHASYAYLNSKLQEFVRPVLAPTSLYNVLFQFPTQGSELPFTPRHKLSAEMNYTFPVGEDLGKLSLGVVYTYTSRALYQEILSSARTLIGSPTRVTTLGEPDDPTILPSYSLVNLNVSWENAGNTGLDAQFFMTNAFNKRYFVANNISTSQGFLARYYGEPRMYGVRLRKNF